MKFQLLFAAAAVLALTGCASVKEVESPSNITLETLESKMNRAVDPDNKYDKAKSFVQRQIFVTEHFMDDPEEKIVETKFQDPANLRVASYIDNTEENALIYNGKAGWYVDYNKKKVIDITGETLDRLQIVSVMASPQSKYSAVFHDIKITDVEIGEDQFIKIDCRRNAGDLSHFEIYVNPQTYLISRIKITLVSDGNTYVNDTVINKYTVCDGVKVAADASVNDNGVTQQVRSIYYKLDPVFKDSEFLPPGF